MEPKLAGEVADAAGSEFSIYIVRLFRPARLSSAVPVTPIVHAGLRNDAAQTEIPPQSDSV